MFKVEGWLAGQWTPLNRGGWETNWFARWTTIGLSSCLHTQHFTSLCFQHLISTQHTLHQKFWACAVQSKCWWSNTLGWVQWINTPSTSDTKLTAHTKLLKKLLNVLMLDSLYNRRGGARLYCLLTYLRGLQSSEWSCSYITGSSASKACWNW